MESAVAADVVGIPFCVRSVGDHFLFPTDNFATVLQRMRGGARESLTPTGLSRVFGVTERLDFQAFPQYPLFGRPGDYGFDDLRYEEQHDGAAEVFAHGFHVAALEFYGGHAHKEGGGGDYLSRSSPPPL